MVVCRVCGVEAGPDLQDRLDWRSYGTRKYVFEPSAADRQWAAQDYADRYERTCAELNAIERTGARIGNRLEVTRVALKKVESVLHDEPTDHDIDAWADYGAWCARMQDAHDGVEFEPRSTPVSDQDIENVNVAG